MSDKFHYSSRQRNLILINQRLLLLRFIMFTFVINLFNIINVDPIKKKKRLAIEVMLQCAL